VGTRLGTQANRLLDTDLGALRDVARRFVTAELGRDSTPAAQWNGIVQQGWLEALLEADAPAIRTLCLLSAELGRAAVALPLAESVAPTLAARNWLDEPALGEMARATAGAPLTVAVYGETDRRRPNTLRLHRPAIASVSSPAPSTDSWRGAGHFRHVEHLSLAKALLAIDARAQCIAWCALPGEGVTAVPTAGYADPPWHDVSLEQTPLSAGTAANGSRWLIQVIRLAAVARAWGAAAAALEQLTDYVKVREQFGQIIGRFQSMQHRLANLQITLNAARVLVSRAAWSLDDPEDADWQAHTAAACCYSSRALRQLALECQHGFGAVGYMEDHPMPHWFRRIHSDLVRHADADVAAMELADRLLEHDDGADFVTRRVRLTPEAEALRREVAAWLSQHWSAGHRAEHYAGGAELLNFDRRFLRAIGERGFIGLTIPAAEGGLGLGALEQFAFDEEINISEAPSYSYATAQLLAPSLARYGSAAQRERFLPLMLRGHAVFCLGYSEPNSGSDLASLRTRAERDGDGWVVNGAKIWTTLGTVGDYVWLAARTDPSQPRHGGISVFIVPLRSPGITIKPLRAMNGEQPCAVFYDDVRLTSDALVGEVNQGWRVITHALSQERMLMGGFASRLSIYLKRIVTELRDTARREPALSASAGMRARLGEIAAEVQASRLLALQASLVAAEGGKPVAEAAISKTFAGELEERMAEAAMDWFGPDATLRRGSPGALLEGQIPHSLVMGIMYVVGGGSNDIQRNIIAQSALGLPR
jgi:alkylation response protein AidB-like acyl-CoA dehydrogenase